MCYIDILNNEIYRKWCIFENFVKKKMLIFLNKEYDNTSLYPIYI